jgi:hydrogenase maturation factor
MVLPIGKLPPELLKKWLSRIPINDPRVVIGPRYGVDAAVIDMGDKYLVAKTDPITFTTRRLGWHAVNVNANDIATTGARPQWFLGTLLLPEGHTDERLVDDIFGDIIHACEDLHITLCGGHCEVTQGIPRPILVGQMLGEVAKDRLLKLSDARPGDKLLLTKGVAIEGTSILAHEKAREVRKALGDAFQIRALDFVNNPGISVVKEALAAADVRGVVGMHDPTEGGAAMGLAEVAEAANCGLRVRRDAIAIYPECAKLCEVFRLDPLGLIASGALIIVTRPDAAEAVCQAVKHQGVACVEIGALTQKREGMLIETAQGIEPLRYSATDELTKVL